MQLLRWQSFLPPYRRENSIPAEALREAFVRGVEAREKLNGRDGAELSGNVGAVHFDRASRKVQEFRHFLVALSLIEQLEDFAFAARKIVEKELQRPLFLQGLADVEGLADREVEDFGVDRLLKEAHGAVFHGAHDGAHVGRARKEDDGDGALGAPQFFLHLDDSAAVAE